MGMSEGFGGDDEALVSAINVTPLVDVMLVLLVIFMVTAPMLNQGVEVDLPRASTQALQTDSQPVVVSLQKEGALFVGEESIELAQLPERVASELEKQGNPQGQVYVKADAALDYGEVMEVIGALHARGLTQVGLVTEAE